MKELIKKLVLASAYCVFMIVSAIINFIPGLPDLLDFGSSLLAACLRLFIGFRAVPGLDKAKRPSKLLQLFEFEGCPFCRKVREHLSVLALEAIIYPCPRETFEQYGYYKESRFRPVVEKEGGKLRFPFLFDPNTGKKMYESDAIIEYLWEEYGPADAKRPLLYTPLFSPLRMISHILVVLLRPFQRMGLFRTPSKWSSWNRELELYSIESSPRCRLVRETLGTLEIPFIVKNVPFGSPQRKEFKARLSKTDIPYLEDPNTGWNGYGFKAINKYLRETYQAGESTSKESILDYETTGSVDQGNQQTRTRGKKL